MEDSLSSTNYKISNSDIDLRSSSSEDSSWSLYLYDSVVGSDAEDAVICSDSRRSSIHSGIASSVNILNDENDHLASAKSAAKRRKITETSIDPELLDTATSHVCNSDAHDLEQMHMKLQKRSNVSNKLPPMRLGKHNYGSFFQGKQNTSSQTGEVLQSGFTRDDTNNAGLKEKGLCLVPISLLFQFRDTKYHHTYS